MLSIDWVVFIAILAALGGAGLMAAINAWRSRRGGGLKAVQAELTAAREAHEAYRRDVAQHFDATAACFKTATTAYVDLHNQLARSAAALCGDLTRESLIDAPAVNALQTAEKPVARATDQATADEAPAGGTAQDAAAAGSDQAERTPAASPSQAARTATGSNGSPSAAARAQTEAKTAARQQARAGDAKAGPTAAGERSADDAPATVNKPDTTAGTDSDAEAGASAATGGQADSGDDDADKAIQVPEATAKAETKSGKPADGREQQSPPKLTRRAAG